MPLIYRDKEVTNNPSAHPGLVVDFTHPTISMERSKVGEDSVFTIPEKFLPFICQRYLDGWSSEIVDEFGNTVYSSDWKEILSLSKYLIDGKVSDHTIGEYWDAKQMEKKILDNTS